MTEVTLAKKLQVCNNLKDRISQLPDEILIDILSLLPLKEAGKSSALSHRWRNLWKMMKRLDFDAPENLPELYDLSSRKGRRAWSTRYVTWVNEVLKLQECPSIEEFRVKCDLDITANYAIGNWIKFLAPKRVKILEIKLSHWGLSKACSLSQGCYHYFTSYDSLRSISLDSINIDGKLLEYFLSRCSHLETFSISLAWRPLSFKVKVTSPSLRHLEIVQCHFTTIELSAPKLMTFKYLGGETKFRIGNNPCLTNLSLGGSSDVKVMSALIPFSILLPQLKTLQLKVFAGFGRTCIEEIRQVPQLTNLKHLILDVEVLGDQSIIGITTIIEAAPFLDKFTLQILQLSGGPLLPQRPNVSPAQYVHESLKVVELLGFVDLELASHLLSIAINLERIVIHPSRDMEMETEDIRKHAYEELKDSLPPKAKLIIL